MPEPYVAGSFKAAPVRVHAYSNGKLMLVDEAGQGCWEDPHGRILLPTLDLVDRVLKAHGYARDEMAVKRIERADTDEVAPSWPDASVEDAPEDAPGGEDSPASGESFGALDDAPEAPDELERAAPVQDKPQEAALDAAGEGLRSEAATVAPPTPPPAPKPAPQGRKGKTKGRR